MDFLFLEIIFRLYPGLTMSFEHNSACFCWDSEISLREMDQKFPFGGLIGYGNYYVVSILCYLEIFRLHATLHDAAGAVRWRFGKEPGYCHKNGRGRNSCLLGHVTGLLFCLYLKIFVPSIFNSVDFWSSMSLIVLNLELTGKKVIKKLGVLFDGSLQWVSFCTPNTFKPNKQTTWNTSYLHGIAWSIGKLD